MFIILRFVFSLIFLIMISSCAREVVSSALPLSPDTAITPVTIDNSGVIPVFEYLPTTTIIYVHNNSNMFINNIKYTVSHGSQILNDVIDKRTANNCANLAPFSSCFLSVTTPTLIKGNTGGWFEVDANYVFNQKPHKFAQIINYAKIADNRDGIHFSSDVMVSGFGNSTGFATAYLYASGKERIYHIKKLGVDGQNLRIANGNIEHLELPVNYVQAIEVSNTSGEIEGIARLEAISDEDKQVSKDGQFSEVVNYTATANLELAAKILIGPKLITSSIDILDTANTVNGQIELLNIGSDISTPIEVSTPSSITADTSSCNNLMANSGCTINYTIHDSSGSGVILVSYDGHQLMLPMYWYNSKGGAFVNALYEHNLNLIRDTVVTKEISITNNGGFAINNFSVSINSINPAALSILTNNCPETFPVGMSCQLRYSLSAASPGQLNIHLTGSYSNNASIQPYSISYPVYYSVAARSGFIISGLPQNSVYIAGDGSDVRHYNFTLRNDSANITLLGNKTFLQNGSPLTGYIHETDNCGSYIAVSDSCSGSLTIGPFVNPATSSESGVVSYAFEYSNGGESSIESGAFRYLIGSNQQRLLLESVTDGQTAISGNGSESEPYAFYGWQTTRQQITLHYRNVGTSEFEVESLIDINSANWKLDHNLSNCVSGARISSGNQCSLVYYNNLANYESSGIGAVYNMNLVIPQVIYRVTSSAIQLQSMPLWRGGDRIYAASYQATVANSAQLISNSNGDYRIEVSTTVANMSGYEHLSISTMMENYFQSYEIMNGSCNVSSGSPFESYITSQDCSFSQDGSSRVRYSILPSLVTSPKITLHMIFSSNLLLPEYVVLNPSTMTLDVEQ